MSVVSIVKQVYAFPRKDDALARMHCRNVARPYWKQTDSHIVQCSVSDTFRLTSKSSVSEVETPSFIQHKQISERYAYLMCRHVRSSPSQWWSDDEKVHPEQSFFHV